MYTTSSRRKFGKVLDRRSISYTVLLKESAETSEEQALLRQQVFERLNTGGVKLRRQEIRNSLYHSPFNDLLLEVSRHPAFRTAWDIPLFTESELKRLSEELVESNTFVMMRDLEMALRFFALRHVDHYQRGMKGFLDLYMFRARLVQPNDIDVLRELFLLTIDTASKIYGDLLFRPWKPESQKWADKAQVAFADAVMVGLSRQLERRDLLVANRDAVIQKTQQLFQDYEPRHLHRER